MSTERDLFISLGDVVRQTPLPLNPKVRTAGDATAYVNLNTTMRPNVALRMSHLTTNSLSYQCPTHPAYADGRAKLRSD